MTTRTFTGNTDSSMGKMFCNPFGARFREKLGTIVRDGSNFGGEVLSPRAMATARFLY